MLEQRQHEQAKNLATLTGWNLDAIYKKMKFVPATEKKWWEW
jgi:hypothetical protein